MKWKCISIFFVVLSLVMAGIIIGLAVYEEEDGMPDLGNVREGWTPTNYSDLWDYNFSFTHGTSFNITIEDYRLYGFPIKQNIILDVRGKNPSLHIYGGATVERDKYVREYGDGNVRTVWTIWGLAPNETYRIVFHGEGKCGMLQEAWV